jgi:ubiquinone/menaquinone biosynthesis C-methylase UbiE
MTTLKSFKSGDFAGLAEDYSNYRPDYCPSVLNGFLGLFEQDKNDLDFTDIGAGTGIWTRMVYDAGVNTATAIEPNQDMRRKGKQNNIDKDIIWLAETAEETTLNDNSMDWISMASSFHWTDFEKATAEFYRVLKPNGRFTALWNPRLIEVNPLLVEKFNIFLDFIEAKVMGLEKIEATYLTRAWSAKRKV